MLILLKSKQGRNSDYKDIYSMLSPIASFINYLLKASNSQQNKKTHPYYSRSKLDIS